ncbi:MAG: hypothetical protein AAF217_12445 [Pseudomonadota bacterium]
MFGWILRTIGLLFLVLTVVTIILDLTRSIANSTFTLTPLGLEWRNFDISSLQSFQVGIERHIGIPWLWENVIQTVLLWPSWVVFFGFSVVFLWLGRRPERRWRKRII